MICDMGSPATFLIVGDFIQWSKENDIPVGQGVALVLALLLLTH